MGERMNKAFEKILERFDEECISPIYYPGYAIDLEKANEIVKEVEKEYNGGQIPADESIPIDVNDSLMVHINECKNRIDNIKNYINSNPDAATKKCEKNINVLATTINALEEYKKYKGGWIPCSGCNDCKHKECEHYGKV